MIRPGIVIAAGVFAKCLVCEVGHNASGWDCLKSTPTRYGVPESRKRAAGWAGGDVGFPVAMTGDALAEAVRSEERVAVVSGGSRGLGRVLSHSLLADGWRVATFSRSASEFTERMAVEAGDTFLWESLDAADQSGIRTFVRGVAKRFGSIDLLVNNLGTLHQELLLTMTPGRIGALISQNLVAPILLTQACARVMVPRRRGTIVTVSSINAVRGYRGVSVYAAAKAGLEGFNRSVARELGAFNIRVNAVVPGFFDSEMTDRVTELNREKIQRRTPLGRLGTVDEMAAAVLFLASDEARFITGQSLVVDGGITC